ncbi:MAG: hypothetical protein P8I99_06930 [Acidimicrobiales bacterium]|nr:hypothetical protein [Acidimicrobiales bacterium]
MEATQLITLIGHAHGVANLERHGAGPSLVDRSFDRAQQAIGELNAEFAGAFRDESGRRGVRALLIAAVDRGRKTGWRRAALGLGVCDRRRFPPGSIIER